ncbi:peptidoglycan-binding protein [Streptomyces sp. NPDC048270]|uniref:peptidoglycan-binding domain-containing protein n=1 Tax=Streptomyces sp. NPDC048270 TaxID=3154615 RepID=UPI0033DB08E7
MSSTSERPPMSQPGRPGAHASDESAGIPDDHHPLVRPYVASPGGPFRSAGSPAWLQTGPLSFPGPAPSRAAAAAPAPDPAPAPAAEPAPPGARRRRGGGPAVVIGTLLALAVAGGIVLLPGGSAPQPPPRSERAPELSVPVLPARSPGADGEPDPEASAPSGAPSAKAGGSASPGAPTPAAGPSPKATPSPSAPAAEPSGPPGTLRMGDRGPEVRALQELLFGQGFTYVSITGVYDGQTKRGVSQLQRDRGIKGDPQGVYGPATRAALA